MKGYKIVLTMSVGMSGGSAILGALNLAEKLEAANIVVIFPDRGEKYLSTILFE